tara:strand:- start:160 stop:381 length:222 start_codon:yes stop_codon:yes gene_type:complete
MEIYDASASSSDSNSRSGNLVEWYEEGFMEKKCNGIVAGLTAMSLNQAFYRTSVLESPGFLDGTVCLRRGLER